MAPVPSSDNRIFEVVDYDNFSPDFAKNQNSRGGLTPIKKNQKKKSGGLITDPSRI